MKVETFEAILGQLRSQRSKHEHTLDLKLTRARYLLSEKQKILKKLELINDELAAMGDASN